MASLRPGSVFITGCSRGIGLEFVKQFCRLPTPPKHIFATCRNPDGAKGLQELAEKHSNVHVMKFDVTDYEALPNHVDYVKSVVGAEGLNLLLNNAGIIGREKLGEITPDVMRKCYEVNCIAPVMTTQAFLPLLRDASKVRSDLPMGCSRAAILNVSTKVASIQDNASGYRYPYRCSKTALNMANKCESVDLLGDGIAAYLLHPGWVQTEMGGPDAWIDTETSVGGLMNVLAGLGEKENGLFFDYKGLVIPW